MINCGLKDELLVTLVQSVGKGMTPQLSDLIITNNPEITMKGLIAFLDLTSSRFLSFSLLSVKVIIYNPFRDNLETDKMYFADQEQSSSLKRLTYGLNAADDLPGLLAGGAIPSLQYLNLRRAKVAGASLSKLLPRLKGKDGISTLVLDGIKLAGSKVLKELFGMFITIH